MKTSTRGRALLKQREGIVLHTYTDSVGVATIGIGHTAAAGKPFPVPGMTITEAQADEILARDLVIYERAIDAAVKVPVTQNEYDALVSICFNCGPKFAQSTAIKRLNAGDRAGAADAILFWNKPPEIMGRRKSEQKQFLTPYPGMVTPQKPSKATGPVAAGTAGAGAGAAAQQAGLPWWAVLLIAVVVAGVAFTVAWKLKK